MEAVKNLFARVDWWLTNTFGSWPFALLIAVSVYVVFFM